MTCASCPSSPRERGALSGAALKFSHDWLSEYVPLSEAPERVAARMTAAGITVDALLRGGPGGSDTIYDIDIFANRPDCMNHMGVAREYAALVGAPLRAPVAVLVGGGPPTSETIALAIESPDLCARYSARAVLGVRIGPSPDWLRRRLESIGQKPINNVVDATNFVLWEMGHPLHAFDLDQLSGRRILVRRARPGETLVTLDGVERRLTPEMLVIADDRSAVALAGIMGGQATGITDGTHNVLLEGAWFEPTSVRRTARALGLRTDASHRFERGADPEGTLPALDRAAALIAATAGGVASDPPLDLYPDRKAPRVIGFRPERARALLGAALPDPDMRESLLRLAFAVEDAGPGAWRVTVPAFRSDVAREADLIEEVARHRGYHLIPGALPLLPDSGGGRGPGALRERTVRFGLLAAGLSESVNYAMADSEESRLFDPGGPEPVRIENPLQAQASCLRGSLLPGLLRNVAHNLNHGLPACHLFEIGTAFRRARPVPEERTLLAYVLAGRGLPAHWSLPRREVDLHDARGVAELLADLLGLSPLRFSSDRIPFLAPGRGLGIARGDRVLGVAGEIAPEVAGRYGLDLPVFAAEMDLGRMLAERAEERRFRQLPKPPAVRRDLALLVSQEVTFEAIERVVRDAARVPVASLQAFDRYQGPGVPAGSAGLAIQIVFQHPERTLGTDEVQSALEAIVAALASRLGVRLRGARQDDAGPPRSGRGKARTGP